MVIIFGFGDQAQDYGPAAPATCPNCHNIVYLHHIRSERKFSLYFVPLVPISSNEYLACPICKHALPIRREQQGLVRHMHAATNAYRQRRLDPNTYQAEVERFWGSIGRGPGGQQLVRAAPAAATAARPHPGGGVASPSSAGQGPAGGGAVSSTAEELRRLAQLHQAGGLTDEEFATMKKRLLGL
jgi:uncharacterized protein YbaR (Trm112 family)